ncbi:hypothetical protein PILCRDRAFT_811638 [Piloderma croceum F 1598]|uniref:Uncharacterized protein n=1 Tax=Piloderma croceum (strain F 1598) TaxID=765440 RepID=A0A0C3GHL0_PILCF|nr:hypothetical protein PILCRDRAFT_811638 [Piloderma croceum F 1598]
MPQHHHTWPDSDEWESEPQSAPTSPIQRPRKPPPHPPNTFATHFGENSSIWAPYTPLSESQPQTKSLETPTTEEIYSQQGLPFNLHVLNERDRLTLAYASEKRRALVLQCDIAESRYRQQLMLTRISELDALAVRDQLQKANEQLDMGVIVALKSVLAAGVGNRHTDDVGHAGPDSGEYTLPLLPDEWRKNLGVPIAKY